MGQRYPIEQITVFRNFFGLFPHLVFLLLSASWHAEGRLWKIQRWKLGIGRGVVLVGAQMCFYYSLVHMQLATATTLAFSGPLFITLFSIPILGHKVGVWRCIAVLIGFLGVVMVMKPGSDLFTMTAVLPIGAAIFYALTSVSSRLFDSSLPTALINLYATGGALVTTVILVLMTGNWISMIAPVDWLWFIGMGTAGGIAVLLLISAYRMAEPSLLSPFEYFGIPFSFFLGWYFFGEAPFDSLFPGVLFIVGGGLLTIWRERAIARKA